MMKQFVQQVIITGTGSCLPDRVLTNEELEKSVDTSDAWIRETLGIRERRVSAADQATSDLAWKAGRAAIDNAGLTVGDIDLIIVATATPDRIAPSTACIVQDKLGAFNAVAFDIAAVCSGFLYGMSVAASSIASHLYENVLVIGADTFSMITDWERRDCVFFGDGAGAAVMSHTNNDDEGFLAFRLYSDGSGKDAFTVPAGGSENPPSHETIEKGLHSFRMDGRKVFEKATTVLPEAILQVLADTGLSVDDIDFMIPHQPSIGILRKTAEILGLPIEKVMMNMDRYANTSGGTIPILLDEVNRAGSLQPGSIVLFAAIGSGWTWGASLMRWGG